MPMDFVAIDFETANRRRASACSIGMVRVRSGQVVDTFYKLLRPDPFEFEFINTSTHGIMPEMVRDSPSLLEDWPSILEFIGRDVLVAHNASFEQSVINQTFFAKGYQVPELDYLCTLYMSKVNYPRRIGYRLPDIYKDIFGKSVNHHHALEDAFACAELGVHMIGKFREQDPRALISVLYEIPLSKKQDWKKLTGIKPAKDELNPAHPLFEKKVAITGELTSMSREQAIRLMVNCGAMYLDSVTKSCNYLVVGDQEHQLAMYGKKSNKYLNAEKYNATGCEIGFLNENSFLELVKEVVE